MTKPNLTTFSRVESWIERYPALRWLPMLLWMGLIFLVSGRESSQLPDLGVLDLLLKKLAHMIAYGILVVFALWGTRSWKWALPITILYAISDEWHQTFVPGRNGTPVDVLIDTAGAIITLILYQRWFLPTLWPRLRLWLTD